MPQHPFILVDDKKRTGGARPLRAPVLLHREVFFYDDGFTLRLGSEGHSAVLVSDGGLHRIKGTKRGGLLAVDEAFKIGRHPFRLMRGDELLVDPRRSGDFVLFNCFHARGDDAHWRAFRIDDAARTLLDWTAAGTSSSSAGVSLQAFLLAKAGKEARFAAPLARAAVDALVRAAEDPQFVQTGNVYLTWDGATHLAAPSLPQEFNRDPARSMAVLVARQLRGEEPEPSRDTNVHFEELVRQPAATADELATAVREMFPEAWAIEAAVRAQAVALDVNGIG